MGGLISSGWCDFDRGRLGKRDNGEPCKLLGVFLAISRPSRKGDRMFGAGVDVWYRRGIRDEESWIACPPKPELVLTIPLPIDACREELQFTGCPTSGQLGTGCPDEAIALATLARVSLIRAFCSSRVGPNRLVQSVGHSTLRDTGGCFHNSWLVLPILLTGDDIEKH